METFFSISSSIRYIFINLISPTLLYFIPAMHTTFTTYVACMHARTVFQQMVLTVIFLADWLTKNLNAYLQLNWADIESENRCKKSWARPRIANRTTIGWKCLGDNFHIFDTLLYVGYSSPNLSISEWLGCVQLSCFSLKPLLSLLCFACHCYGIVRVTMLCVGVPSKQNNKLNSWRT